MGMSLQDALAVQKVPECLKNRARRGKKVYLGEETRPGWTGYLPFYLFQCPNPDCRMLVKDYPHGFPERQYLSCPECGERVSFVRFWVGVREFILTIISIFKLRFSRRQESGKY